MGLVKLGPVAIDGTKIRTNASQGGTVAANQRARRAFVRPLAQGLTVPL